MCTEKDKKIDFYYHCYFVNFQYYLVIEMSYLENAKARGYYFHKYEKVLISCLLLNNENLQLKGNKYSLYSLRYYINKNSNITITQPPPCSHKELECDLDSTFLYECKSQEGLSASQLSSKSTIQIKKVHSMAPYN